MRLRIFQLIILLTILSSHLAFAIEPIYEGTDGVKTQVFAAHCLSCHSSNLSGGQRNGAPIGLDWDIYTKAKEKGDRIIIRAVQLMSMPPGQPKLNQQQQAAMLAWQQAGFPQFQTNTVLDVDGNGQADALTDGIIILRFLFNFSGTSLTNDVIGNGSTRTDPADIIAFLEANAAALDVDGNGQNDALTDGLLILRFLFEFSGATLISDIIGNGATRTTATAIENHLQSLL